MSSRIFVLLLLKWKFFAVELTLCRESLIFDCVCDMLRCCFILCGSEMLIDATMNSIVYGPRLAKKTVSVEFLFSNLHTMGMFGL